MKIRVEDKVYTFDQDDADNVELMNIERVMSCTIAEWQEMLSRGSMLAFTALVWILRRRDGESNLAFEDVKFKASAIGLEDDEEGKGE